VRVLLGKGSVRCFICGLKRAVVGWCDPCRKSYDKQLLTGNQTILHSILWAAQRARSYERQRKAKR
jgi:hypothetical protein